MTIKDKSLQRALNASACRELPKAVGEEDTTKSYWVKAIALVRKRDLSQSYCLVERGSDGVIKYKADYGTPSTIFGLVSVHPYVVVDVARFGYAGTDEEFKAYMKNKLRLTKADMECNGDAEWATARIEYAKRKQEESDARFQLTGVMEISEAEVSVESVPSGDAIVAEDNSLEGITIISSASDHKMRRGRKPKQK